MLQRTETGLLDDRAVEALVDRHSPELVRLAGLFADRDVAQRMVVRAWLVVLHAGSPAALVPDVAGLRRALVRALAAGDPDDPEVSAGARALRFAVRSAGCYVPRARGTAPPSGSAALRLHALPGPLRLVVALTDVLGWSSAEVEALLEVRPAARRALLAQARDQLLGGGGRPRAA